MPRCTRLYWPSVLPTVSQPGFPSKYFQINYLLFNQEEQGARNQNATLYHFFSKLTPFPFFPVSLGVLGFLSRVSLFPMYCSPSARKIHFLSPTSCAFTESVPKQGCGFFFKNPSCLIDFSYLHTEDFRQNGACPSAYSHGEVVKTGPKLTTHWPRT